MSTTSVQIVPRQPKAVEVKATISEVKKLPTRDATPIAQIPTSH
eukprot:CAMPEP_0115171996 /NCGR_PEP_ID=MMETSP0270-20121206/2588_1 /TAXON_ID=71861 /ORGANISM="Scrippsiella trochoidea, Strain CCMP3099" /LENGTH=43 /DNA_ID= /DNA_START= /DNA_END= /DNA_ORIENTATION=